MGKCYNIGTKNTKEMCVELYHGTNFKSAVDICKNGIDFSKGGVNLDFGVGFYTTPDLKKAIQRARSKARYQEEEAYIVVLTMDEQKTFGQQISFHTEKALKCIKELKYFNIKQIALQRGVTLYEIR